MKKIDGRFVLDPTEWRIIKFLADSYPTAVRSQTLRDELELKQHQTNSAMQRLRKGHLVVQVGYGHHRVSRDTRAMIGLRIVSQKWMEDYQRTMKKSRRQPAPKEQSLPLSEQENQEQQRCSLERHYQALVCQVKDMAQMLLGFYEEWYSDEPEKIREAYNQLPILNFPGKRQQVGKEDACTGTK